MSNLDHLVQAMEKAQSNMPIPKSLPTGERRSTRDDNTDGILDFFEEDQIPVNPTMNWNNVPQYAEFQQQNLYPQGYNQAPQGINSYPQGYNQYPQDDYQQQIINRQPQPRHQAISGSFNTSEELYNQFKLFILGPVSTNPDFDFPELLDILDDMKEMTEVLEQQKSRRRKVQTYTKGNKYMSGVNNSAYDSLDDEVVY